VLRRQTEYYKVTMKWRLDDGQIEVVDDAMAEVLRRKTPAERVAMVSALNEFLRTMLESVLRGEHPDWEDGRITNEVARRMSHGTD